MLGKESELNHASLDEAEVKLFKLVIINNCHNLREKYREAVMGKREDMYNLVEGGQSPHLNYLIRAYLQSEIAHADTPLMHLAMPLAPQLAALWCPDKYTAALEKLRAKSAKARKAIIDKLTALGYDEQGKKIE